jgi:hypothetical protein
MVDRFRLALAQLNPTVGAVEANLAQAPGPPGDGGAPTAPTSCCCPNSTLPATRPKTWC